VTDLEAIDELLTLANRAAAEIVRLRNPDAATVEAAYKALLFDPATIGRIRVVCVMGLSDAAIGRASELLRVGLATEGVTATVGPPEVTTVGDQYGTTMIEWDFGGPGVAIDPWANVRRVIEGGYFDATGRHVAGIGTVIQAIIDMRPTTETE
jgi:hypothetical protein